MPYISRKRGGPATRRHQVSLHEKVVLITGATSPLGARLVDTFAHARAKLALCVRRVSDLATLQRDLDLRGIRALLSSCDLRHEEDVIRLVHRVVQRYGRIDVVINAANVTGPKQPLVDYPADPWRNVIDTNLTGAYLLCREVLPWMTRQGSGSIINVTSDLLEKSASEWGAYFVSNHSIEGLTKLLAAELEGSGVRANTITVGLPDNADAATEPRDNWLDAFLWLAGDESNTTTGNRVAAATFAGRPPVH